MRGRSPYHAGVMPDAPPAAPDAQSGEADGHRHATRWLLVFIAGSVVLGLVWDLLFGELIPFNPEEIGERLDGMGSIAPLAYIAAMTLAVVVSPVPSVPLDIAAGLAFGLLWGTVYTLIGAEAGAIIAFLIARRMGRPWLARKLPAPTMRRIDDLATRQGVKALLVTRLLPVFNFDWVSYAAGLTAISLPRFAIATLIGMTPPVIAITAVGSTYADSPVLSISILVVLVVLATGPLMMLMRRPRKAAPAPSRNDVEVPGG